jgi:hypothetical protein
MTRWPKPLGRRVQARERALHSFYRYYGEAMSLWAEIEYALSLWFGYACEPGSSNAYLAYKLFYSARSFNGSADMLKAAWHERRRDEKLSELFAAVNKKTRAYYQFRNRLAHHLTVYLEKKREVVLAAPDDAFLRQPTTSKCDLMIAIRNFGRLKLILLYSLPGLLPKPRLTPEQALQYLELLPAQAQSPQQSQKQRNRIRQRQLRPQKNGR